MFVSYTISMHFTHIYQLVEYQYPFQLKVLRFKYDYYTISTHYIHEYQLNGY